MKKLFTICFVLVIAFSSGRISSTFAAETDTVIQNIDWNMFGKNIERALLSDNPGLQRSAMQMVIRHGDKLNIGRGTIEILRTYRSGADVQVRRLALSALPKTGSSLVMGYLKRAVEFEKSPVLKKQIEFILAEHEKN